MKCNLPMKSSRRGITLVFVVSLIVLFMLMGVAFAVLSTQFRKSIKSESRIRDRRDDARTLVNRVFYDLLRGPSLGDSTSPLRGHSLLGDLYGYGAKGTVDSAPAAPQFLANSGNQMIELSLGTQYQDLLSGSNLNWSDLTGAYDGLVLTFVDGPAAGLSCRVFSYVTSFAPPPITRKFYIVPVWNNQVSGLSNPANLAGSTVVLNGRPYAGTGAGVYCTNTPLNQAALFRTALEPNRRGDSRQTFINEYASTGEWDPMDVLRTLPPINRAANSGSENEDYDAPDFQNMFLAGYAADGSFIKSFERLRLENYSGLAANYTEFKVSGMPYADLDEDGSDDSIWMDLGLPTMTDANGTIYKPLAAVMIQDLDSRLNVNAHGNLTHVDGLYKNNLGLLGGGAAPGLGQGYGPPEIHLGIPGSGLTAGDYATLLRGGGGYLGRYGTDGYPGIATRDNSSALKLSGYPYASFANGGLVNTPATGSYFRSSLDIHGRLGIGHPTTTDLATGTVPVGMPVVDILNSTLADEISNSAYEFSFVSAPFAPGSRSADAPFTAAELERILRVRDFESRMLPSRLEGILANSISSAPELRRLITTDSYEVPVPPSNLVGKLANALNTFGVVTADNVNSEIRTMLPPELIKGRRFDVNRPFGNGVDDNGNGIVDEPSEAGTENFPDPYGRTFSFDPDGNGTLNAQDGLARYHFARNLYVVTLLVTQWVDRDGNGTINSADWFDYTSKDVNGDNVSNATDDLLAYRIDVAQWAMNVVDFRDPDSVMTPFEFDLNPWDGWGVNGALDDSTMPTPDSQMGDRYVVWGVERPEMLVTETVGMHQRRTEDLREDDGDRDTVASGNDNDLDSQQVPMASAFIELYLPWVHTANATLDSNNTYYPPELYGTTGIDLQRMSPDGTSPIWRISVRRRFAGDGDSLTALNAAAADEIRRIYFKQPDVTVDTGSKVYFPTNGFNELAPGRYAVLGSSGVEDGTRYTTYFGRRNTGTWNTELADTRRLSLLPGSDQVEYRYFDGAAWQTSVRNCLAIPISQADATYPSGRRSLGFSDPLMGYNQGLPANVVVQNTPAGDGWEYYDTSTMQPYIFDEPRDFSQQNTEWSTLNDNEMPLNSGNYLDPTGLRDDGLHENDYSVHLQRLANPLEAYHPTYNPYITIDVAGVDVSVFNGVAADPETDAAATTLERAFASVERGTNEYDNATLGTTRRRWLWRSTLDGRYDKAAVVLPPLADSHHQPIELIHSLGEIDNVYRPVPPAPFTARGLTEAFPWLKWNNRPYVSHLELAEVPYGDAFSLLCKFDVLEPNRDAYSGVEAANTLNQQIPLQSGQFGHLWGFHNESFSTGAPRGAPSLQKVLDYLEVPSRYVGTEMYVNPNVFSGPSGVGSNHGLAAPFDAISSYRSPGKINLNTLNNQRVYDALMAHYRTLVPFADFVNSRDTGGAGLPTDFAGAFRSAEAANWVPRLPSGTPDALVQTSSAVSLYRRNPSNPAKALFDDSRFDAATGPIVADPTRSAHFRYDLRQRLGNMVSHRSSVFAIWIQVKFFRVDPVTQLPDASQQQSPPVCRGFFIVDRSIPVAFEPGANHNVDNCVLVSSIYQREMTAENKRFQQ